MSQTGPGKKGSDYCLLSHGCSVRSLPAAGRSGWVARLQDSQEYHRKKTDRAMVLPSFAAEETQLGSQGRDGNSVHGGLRFSDRGIHVPPHPVPICPVDGKKQERGSERQS